MGALKQGLKHPASVSNVRTNTTTAMLFAGDSWNWYHAVSIKAPCLQVLQLPSCRSLSRLLDLTAPLLYPTFKCHGQFLALDYPTFKEYKEVQADIIVAFFHAVRRPLNLCTFSFEPATVNNSLSKCRITHTKASTRNANIWVCIRNESFHSHHPLSISY